MTNLLEGERPMTHASKGRAPDVLSKIERTWLVRTGAHVGNIELARRDRCVLTQR